MISHAGLETSGVICWLNLTETPVTKQEDFAPRLNQHGVNKHGSTRQCPTDVVFRKDSALLLDDGALKALASSYLNPSSKSNVLSANIRAYHFKTFLRMLIATPKKLRRHLKVRIHEFDLSMSRHDISEKLNQCGFIFGTVRLHKVSVDRIRKLDQAALHGMCRPYSVRFSIKSDGELSNSIQVLYAGKGQKPVMEDLSGKSEDLDQLRVYLAKKSLGLHVTRAQVKSHAQTSFDGTTPLSLLFESLYQKKFTKEVSKLESGQFKDRKETKHVDFFQDELPAFETKKKRVREKTPAAPAKTQGSFTTKKFSWGNSSTTQRAVDDNTLLLRSGDVESNPGPRRDGRRNRREGNEREENVIVPERAADVVRDELRMREEEKRISNLKKQQEKIQPPAFVPTRVQWYVKGRVTNILSHDEVLSTITPLAQTLAGSVVEEMFLNRPLMTLMEQDLFYPTVNAAPESRIHKIERKMKVQVISLFRAASFCLLVVTAWKILRGKKRGSLLSRILRKTAVAGLGVTSASVMYLLSKRLEPVRAATGLELYDYHERLSDNQIPTQRDPETHVLYQEDMRHPSVKNVALAVPSNLVSYELRRSEVVLEKSGNEIRVCRVQHPLVYEGEYSDQKLPTCFVDPTLEGFTKAFGQTATRLKGAHDVNDATGITTTSDYVYPYLARVAKNVEAKQFTQGNLGPGIESPA